MISFFKKYRKYVAVLGVIISSVSTIGFFAPKLIILNDSILFFQTLENATTGLSTTVAIIKDVSKQIAESPEVKHAFLNDNQDQLIEFLKEKKNHSIVDGILVSDINGRVLGRAKLFDKKGDYLYEMFSWLRVADKQPLISIEKGTTSPLIIVGANPIVSDTHTLGVASTGIFLDSTNATIFKNKYISSNANIAFYTKENGVVGSSFSRDIETLLMSSEMKGLTDKLYTKDNDVFVKIKHQIYFVHNIRLWGVDNQTGGVMIFIPANHTEPFLAIVVLLLYVYSMMFYYFFVRHKSSTSLVYDNIVRWRLYIGGFFCVLIITTTVIFFSLRQQTFVLPEKNNDKNASFNIEPSVSIVSTNQSYPLSVSLLSVSQVPNKAHISLIFNPLDVQISKDVDFSTGICTKDSIAKIDAKKGTIQIDCSIDKTKYLLYKNTLAKVTILPKSNGLHIVRISESSNIVESNGEIINPSVMTVLIRSTSERSPVILYSPTHPNSEVDYDNHTFKIFWRFSSGVTYKYALVKGNTVTQNDFTQTNTGDMSFTISESGAYTFFVRAYKNNKQIGEDFYPISIK